MSGFWLKGCESITAPAVPPLQFIKLHSVLAQIYAGLAVALPLRYGFTTAWVGRVKLKGRSVRVSAVPPLQLVSIQTTFAKFLKLFKAVGVCISISP